MATSDSLLEESAKTSIPLPPTKPKKDKSSKKRKANDLAEFIPSKSPGTEKENALECLQNLTNTSIPTFREDQSPTTADEDSQEPPRKKVKTPAAEIEVDINAPEPPSKKALRRLKKGKPLPPSKSGAESTPEPETRKDKKPEIEKRSEYGVWIGNLPWSVSKADLRTFLVEYSDITEQMITRVHMPGPDDGKSANKVEENKFSKKVHNKGFAYVDFSSAQAVEMAVELSEQLLSGRRLLIKNNKSFEGRPEKTKQESRNDGKPPSKRVFLGNLSFDTTEVSLKGHFEKCGAIESIKVATFEDSGKCKGYAWIVFEELEAAHSAVRGFVHVEEESSDASESESDGESVAEGDDNQLKPKKIKTRKWWVNKIKGRPLRMEFAEDAQVRYKKRYGKEGTNSGTTEAIGTSGEEAEKSRMPAKTHAKVVEYRQSYAPRLTGGIVESKGKKTTF